MSLEVEEHADENTDLGPGGQSERGLWIADVV
jgi:hypothetical protein